jgi:hypothetical protein
MERSLISTSGGLPRRTAGSAARGRQREIGQAGDMARFTRSPIRTSDFRSKASVTPLLLRQTSDHGMNGWTPLVNPGASVAGRLVLGSPADRWRAAPARRRRLPGPIPGCLLPLAPFIAVGGLWRGAREAPKVAGSTLRGATEAFLTEDGLHLSPS